MSPRHPVLFLYSFLSRSSVPLAFPPLVHPHPRSLTPPHVLWVSARTWSLTLLLEVLKREILSPSWCTHKLDPRTLSCRYFSDLVSTLSKKSNVIMVTTVEHDSRFPTRSRAREIQRDFFFLYYPMIKTKKETERKRKRGKEKKVCLRWDNDFSSRFQFFLI